MRTESRSCGDSGLSWVLAVVLLALRAGPVFAASVNVWAIGEGVRINPLTGKAFEENEKMLPGCIKGDYRSKNWVWDGPTKTISVKGAANEVASFQIIIEGGGVTGINLAGADLQGPEEAVIPAKNITFFRAFYVRVNQRRDNKRAPFPLEGGWYPDPLVPLDTPKIGAPFAIDGSNFGGQKPEGIKNQTVWVDVWIPKELGKGNYKGKLTVSSDPRNVELNLNVEVFGFEMPDENHNVLELMSYTGFAWLKRELRDRIFILAHQHRATITCTKPIVNPRFGVRDGKLNWPGFDKAWGPAIGGSLFKEGPRAGVPASHFGLPFDPRIKRPDKGRTRGRGWPIRNPLKNGNMEVDFTPEYVRQFSDLLRQASDHFQERYPKTTILIYQDGLDEPGFHKGNKDMAMAQLRSIRGYVKIIKELGRKNVVYKLDIGGGFARCRYDLDEDGTREGSKEVVDGLMDVGLWNVHGLCVKLDVLKPVIDKGAHVWFYNGFEPRVGPTTIGCEALGPRTWAWVVWNSDMNGMCNWSFLYGAKGAFTTGGTQKHPGDAMFMYYGEDVGHPSLAFPSMRLKAYRRGMQDYEYFHLLAKADGKKDRAKGFSTLVVRNSMNKRLEMKGFEDDAVGEIAKVRIEGDQRHWSHHPADFEKVRYRIGELLGR